jgi:hypothetical protein
MSEYDVAGVRAHFPALDEGAAHFDGPGGSQVPDVVAEAVAGTLRAAMANRGTVTRAERRADRIVVEARLAAADLLGAECIVFGRSMTQLTYDLSRALAKQWRQGDEIVVSRLDHDANIRPWLHAAQGRGVAVRWAEFDRHTGELPVEAIGIPTGLGVCGVAPVLHQDRLREITRPRCGGTSRRRVYRPAAACPGPASRCACPAPGRRSTGNTELPPACRSATRTLAT